MAKWYKTNITSKALERFYQMHTYAQILQQRFLDSGGSVADWAEALCAGQIERVFEEAPSCKCGCGEKLFPTNLKRLLRNPNLSLEFKYACLPGHGRLILPRNYEFSKQQRELIVASCFGDGSLLRNSGKTLSSHRLVWNMGDKLHAEFKRDAFDFLGAILVEKSNPGWGAKWFSVRTACHPSLDKFREQFYGVDRKPVAKEDMLAELGDVGWAWWYGDDGSLMHQKGCADMALLHTEGYSEECNLKIKLALEKFIGVEGGVSLARYLGGSPKKPRTMLRVNTNATVEFFKRISPHMAPSMAYKLGDFRVD